MLAAHDEKVVHMRQTCPWLLGEGLAQSYRESHLGNSILFCGFILYESQGSTPCHSIAARFVWWKFPIWAQQMGMQAQQTRLRYILLSTHVCRECTILLFHLCMLLSDSEIGYCTLNEKLHLQLQRKIYFIFILDTRNFLFIDLWQIGPTHTIWK